MTADTLKEKISQLRQVEETENAVLEFAVQRSLDMVKAYCGATCS